MFRSKTVFVVGAGASCEVGLPDGAKLKKLISSLLDIKFEIFGRQESGDTRIVSAINEYTGGPLSNVNPYLEKAWRIRDAMPASISIDNYLDAHQGDVGLELCGKLAIVKSILDAEGSSRLASTEEFMGGFDLRLADNSWYLKFMQLLTEGVRRDRIESVFDNVSIIAFNYDRCIERYVVPALSSYYNISEADAISVVSNLRIYHPYGQVGALPWQQGESARFGNGRTSNLLAISKGIKTFTEGKSDDAVMGSIRGVMSEAETIVFLGFAFHQQNLELIRPADSAATRVFGTAMGVSSSDQAVVRRVLRGMLGARPTHYAPSAEKVEVSLIPSSCYGLFEEYWRSISAAAPH